MFDIGFFEFSLVVLVALLVIGPERLPSAARTLGLWIGHGKLMIAKFNRELDNEIAEAELQKELRKQSEPSPTVVNDTKEIS